MSWQIFTSRRSVLCASLCLLMALIVPAEGQEINEDFSVYPSALTMLPGNHFGRAVAIDDGILAVGAYFFDFDKDNNDYGSAHLFNASSGAHIRQLLPNDSEPNNFFGRSIDISDGIAVVGAWKQNDPTGSVYVFDVATGIQLHKLMPEDLDPDGTFGLSVAIDNGVIAVGAPIGGFAKEDGSGYVYLFNATTGQQLHKISPNDASDHGNFGYSVDMDSGRLAVGAPSTNNTELNTGALYVFSVSGGVQLRKFAPEGLAFGDHLGWSVASSGTRIAVGAPANGNNIDGVPSVYIYESLDHTVVSQIRPDPADEKIFSDFGTAVALENDIVVVGAELYDDFAGTAFVFNATTGIQATELETAGRVAGDYFGTAVAIEGFTVAAGAPGEEHGSLHTGAVYTFSTFTGNQRDRMVPPPEDRAFDRFGYAMAAGTNVIAVTANGNDTRGVNAGVAYLYDATTRQRLATYWPDEGSNNGNLGYSIDYDSSVVAIGATGDDQNGSNHGAAYLYWGFSGDRIQKLVPGDGNAGDFFGASVALDTGFKGGIVAVGSSFDDDNGTDTGSVYLFDPFTGVSLGKLHPNDPGVGHAFGNAMAIDDGILAVGAYRSDSLGYRSGAVYLFDLATRTQIAKLLPDDGAPSNYFGWSIAMHNGIVAVGAWGHAAVGVNSGAVYLFDASTGNQITKFVPDDAEPEDRFGYSVSMDKGVVLIGSYHDDDNGEDSGAAYIFGASSLNQLYKLIPSQGTADDLFGRSVAICNNTIGIGSIGDSVFGDSSGSAQVFTVPADICPADLTGDRLLDFFDISEFLTAFVQKEPSADFNGDGMYNFFDVSAFLQLFNTGCP